MCWGRWGRWGHREGAPGGGCGSGFAVGAPSSRSVPEEVGRLVHAIKMHYISFYSIQARSLGPMPQEPERFARGGRVSELLDLVRDGLGASTPDVRVVVELCGFFQLSILGNDWIGTAVGSG